MKKANRVLTVLIFIFLYIPMAVLIVASFNTGKDITQFEGFTLSRYAELFRDEKLIFDGGHDVTVDSAVHKFIRTAPEKGKAELVFTNEAGEETFRGTIYDFECPGVLQGQYNKDSSICSFARSCFQFSIDTKQDLWFATKDTISKKYDHRFKDIFNEIFDAEYKQKFDEAGIEYFYTLIDDAVARVNYGSSTQSEQQAVFSIELDELFKNLVTCKCSCVNGVHLVGKMMLQALFRENIGTFVRAELLFKSLVNQFSFHSLVLLYC